MSGNYADGFIPYIRSLGLSSQWSSAARLIDALGCETYQGCCERLASVLARGEISDDSYRTHISALEDLAEARRAGINTQPSTTDATGNWLPIGNGGHMRATRKGSVE